MKELIERDAAIAAVYEQHPEWTRDAIRALPAIDPAQIRAVSEADMIAIRNDTLREAAGMYDEDSNIAQTILALIDQPALSANPVDDKIGADPVANAAQVLLDVLYMKNGTAYGVTKERAQAIWDAGHGASGFSAVVSVLRAFAEGHK